MVTITFLCKSEIAELKAHADLRLTHRIYKTDNAN